MSRSEKRASIPEDFIAGKLGGMEAVVLRIGQGDAKLVLVDGDGRWDHWVYHSVDECRAKAEQLGIGDVSVGHFPEPTRLRMNAHQRPRTSFERGAYPERGEVGPVIPYPENRPRPHEVLPEEAPRRRTHP